MDPALFERKSEFEWHIRPFGKMQVPGVIFASETLLREMDAKVYEQVTNVAMLPGIVEASYAMPDAHWSYGFPTENWLVRRSIRRSVRIILARCVRRSTALCPTARCSPI